MATTKKKPFKNPTNGSWNGSWKTWNYYTDLCSLSSKTNTANSLLREKKKKSHFFSYHVPWKQFAWIRTPRTEPVAVNVSYPGPLGTSPDCHPPKVLTSCASYPPAPTLRTKPRLQKLVQLQKQRRQRFSFVLACTAGSFGKDVENDKTLANNVLWWTMMTLYDADVTSCVHTCVYVCVCVRAFQCLNEWLLAENVKACRSQWVCFIIGFCAHYCVFRCVCLCVCVCFFRLVLSAFPLAGCSDWLALWKKRYHV